MPRNSHERSHEPEGDDAEAYDADQDQDTEPTTMAPPGESPTDPEQIEEERAEGE